MAAAHIFKVKTNKIYEIEATGFTLPFNSPNGWSESCDNTSRTSHNSEFTIHKACR
jgi:hypothetical protein